jgi:membrane-associated protease RseP (regulator of RpoE activity)
MFKGFKILLITAVTIILAEPIFAGTVGIVKESKTSWYAIIGTQNKGKKLYVIGDMFSSDNNPEKSLRIADIKENILILENVVSKNSIIIKAGENIPIEELGMVFEKTVESSVLEYSYNKPAKKVTKNELEDFTVKSLNKQKIILEKDYNKALEPKQLSDKEKQIFSSPRDEGTDKKVLITELFDKIDSKKIGDNIWALNRSSAEPAIHNAGAVILAGIKRVEPQYRFGDGASLKFNTDLGAAVVNKDGFLIQNIAVAKFTENFGIKEGDIIRTINGYPVNSLLGIYRAYESVASNKGAKLLSVDITRNGKIKTLVYKIR